MTNINPAAKTSLLANILKLLSCVSLRRKIQMLLLFIMQVISAFLEVVSIGAIIPFLGALANSEKPMNNPYIAALVEWGHISEPQQLIVLMAVIFSAAIVLANFFRFLTLVMQQLLSAAIAVDLGKTLFSKMLYKPYQYFLDNNTSHLISNTTNDLNSTLRVLSNFFTIITQGLIVFTVAGGLLAYNPKIALTLSIIIIGSYSLIVFLVNRRLHYNSKIYSDSYRSIVKTMQESFGGIRYIILDQLQKNFMARFTKPDRLFRFKNAENMIILQTPKLVIESMGVIAISAITISFTAHNKDISEIIPLMGFLVFGSYRLLPAVQQVYAAISSMISSSVSVERVIEVLADPLQIAQTKPVTPPIKMQKALEFENVFFDYRETGENWTIDNLSFTINAKTTIALVGHTGSGKSTISDLILGLIQPQKGQIKIDGIPLRDNNISQWQASIAHVPQAIFLSDASVAENIAFGIPPHKIDMERIKHAAKMAQIDEFIQTLPAGYDEKVGERGIKLSGGQRQRIGIARALYSNPSLIVFDEATSALDNKTEQDVMNAIDGLKQSLTIVLIAHRLSTVKNADNILMFEKGRLIAQGAYQDLLKNIHFKELVKSEKLD